MRIASTIVLLIVSMQSKAQIGLLIDHYDTVYAKPFLSKKIVAYKYGEVTILLDYESTRKHLKILAQEGRHYFRTARDMMNRLQNEASKGDTAFLDQKYFLRLNWIPFDDFLCAEIESGKCLVKDSNEVIHRTFILATATRRNDQYYVWGGILFFLPEHKDWFIERTKWES